MLNIKKIQLVSVLFFVFCASFGQTVKKTMLKLPDTGQTGIYTSTFGEDADYTINPPFFTTNNNGTVTDTVTGLLWQQTDGGEMTIENARIYVNTLTLAGFKDWRLPTAHESFSILNHQRVNPALDNTFFTTTAAEYWWTSDKQANDSTKIWCTNAGGGVGNHPKSETVSAGGTKKFHVRAVRDVKTPANIAGQFTDNRNGTVTDNLTGLTWQKILKPDTISWESALVYAENLSFAGSSDWRLPNIKELQSINDEKLVNPSVSTVFFSTIGVKKYWSSTSLPNQTAKAWYLSTQFGITTYDLKTALLSVICVRGNTTNTTTAVKETETGNFAVKVFPNPITNNSIQFEVSDVSKNFTVQITDIQGRVLINQVFKSTQYNKVISMDTNNLDAGIYFLKIEGDGGRKIEKIILSKW